MKRIEPVLIPASFRVAAVLIMVICSLPALIPVAHAQAIHPEFLPPDWEFISAPSPQSPRGISDGDVGSDGSVAVSLGYGIGDGRLSFLHTASGKVVWTALATGENFSTPDFSPSADRLLAADMTTVVPDTEDFLSKMQLRDRSGSLVWERNIDGIPSMKSDYIVSHGGDGETVFSLHRASDGAMLWTLPYDSSAGDILAAAVAAGGQVLLRRDRVAQLYSVNGTELCSFTPPDGELLEDTALMPSGTVMGVLTGVTPPDKNETAFYRIRTIGSAGQVLGQYNLPAPPAGEAPDFPDLSAPVGSERLALLSQEANSIRIRMLGTNSQVVWEQVYPETSVDSVTIIQLQNGEMLLAIVRGPSDSTIRIISANGSVRRYLYVPAELNSIRAAIGVENRIYMARFAKDRVLRYTIR